MTGGMRPPMRIFLTHTPDMREHYFGQRALAELRALGEVVLNQRDRPLTADEIVGEAAGCGIVISDRQTPGERAIFAALPDLIAFERVAVDIRNIDVGAASEAGVLVTQASRGFVPAVTEWILGGMIAAARHMVRYVEDYRQGRDPESVLGLQLKGSTIGVIGYGAIAEHLCEVALTLGMRVLVCDPYRRVAAPLVAVDLPGLLAQADFVVPLAVANDETENMIGEDALSRMKPGAWLVNASRGNLVDEAALERALDARRIAGAVLDVGRAQDQKPSLHLACRPDVIAAPHVAGLTREAIEHQALETVAQAASILRGEVPAGAVNAEHASRFAAMCR